MRRAVSIFTFALVLAISEGEVPVFEDDEFSDHAHHGSECQPHVHLPASMVTRIEVKLPSLESERFPRFAPIPPASPEPADILHVPKASLS